MNIREEMEKGTVKGLITGELILLVMMATGTGIGAVLGSAVGYICEKTIWRKKCPIKYVTVDSK